MEELKVTSNEKISVSPYSPRTKRLNEFYIKSISNKYKFSPEVGNSPLSLSFSNDTIEESAVTNPISFEPIIHGTDGEITSIRKNREKINYEDSEIFVNNIFRGRDFIATSESWVSNEIIKARIVNSDNDNVYLDCIIDIETMHFEHRQFNKSLFSNFKTLDTGGLVLIKLKSKPGSFRVDVYPGEGMINSELFDINDDIQELKGRELGTKLREW